MTCLLASENIYIVDGLRTPIGGVNRGLSRYTAPELAAVVIREILKQNRINKSVIDEVILGQVVSAGCGQNPAREAALKAGLPGRTRSLSINNVCGSGMEAVFLGVKSILTQEADCVLCAGAESASNAPYLINDLEKPTDWVEANVHDGLLCPQTGRLMGELVEILTQKYRITRKLQDKFAFLSHQKAVAAISKGKLKKEIVPLKAGRNKKVDRDERPRKNISLANLAQVPPAFGAKGSVTAGNSSALADGAAVCLLAGEKAVQKHSLKPLARILGYSKVAMEPKETFASTAKGIQVALKKSQKSLKDIDLFEIAESFAAQVLLTQKQLKLPAHKVNIYGGDIAYGHPLGAAGCRILVTLIHALKTQKRTYGLSAISYGGGGATAIVCESFDK